VGVHRSTIHRWKHNGWKIECRSTKRLLTNSQEVKLCQELCSGRSWQTQMELSQKAEQMFNVIISQSYVSRMLARNGISFKRATKHFAEQKPCSIPSFLKIERPDPTSWYALDECSFTLNLAPTYAYSPKGQRAVISRPGPRGRRVSLLLCISPKGSVARQWVEGGVKASHFQSFVANLPPKNTFVMDNASIHHANQTLVKQRLPSIAKTIELSESRIVYLPPYCPELNPTELCFNVLKNAARRNRPRTFEELVSLVDETLANTSMGGFFRKCWGDGAGIY